MAVTANLIVHFKLDYLIHDFCYHVQKAIYFSMRNIVRNVICMYSLIDICSMLYWTRANVIQERSSAALSAHVKCTNATRIARLREQEITFPSCADGLIHLLYVTLASPLQTLHGLVALIYFFRYKRKSILRSSHGPEVKS
jgi:hypothetical protein